MYPRRTDGPVAWSDTISASLALANGTGVGQADGYWSGTLTIDAGDSETIDLLALAYTAFGDSGTVSFAAVKSFVIENASTTTEVTVEPGATNGWSKIDGAVTVGTSGIMVMHFPTTGLAVSGSSKTLQFTNTDSVITLAGNTTTGQKSVTGLSSTSGLSAGMLVSGSGIPSGAKVASITNGTSLMLTANATATGSAVSLDFQWPAAAVNVHVAGILD